LLKLQLDDVSFGVISKARHGYRANS
jgi:hypothetical protein